MKIQIELAGYRLDVSLINKNTCKLLSDYIVTDNHSIPDISITIKPEDLFAEQSITLRDLSQRDKAAEFSFLKLERSEFYALHRKVASLMPFYDVFLMHGSVVATDNDAYMFTAPSGVGKTTRSVIWINEYNNSYIINGDRPLLKVADSAVMACGTPWCGKERWNTNTMLPLKAIFLLERTDEKEPDSIEEIGLAEALPFLVKETFFPDSPKAAYKTIKLLNALNGKVRFFRFRSAPTRDAIRLAYEAANQKT